VPRPKLDPTAHSIVGLHARVAAELCQRSPTAFDVRDGCAVPRPPGVNDLDIGKLVDLDGLSVLSALPRRLIKAGSQMLVAFAPSSYAWSAHITLYVEGPCLVITRLGAQNHPTERTR